LASNEIESYARSRPNAEFSYGTAKVLRLLLLDGMCTHVHFFSALPDGAAKEYEISNR